MIELFPEVSGSKTIWFAKGNSEDFICCKCNKEFEVGFLCEDRNCLVKERINATTFIMKDLVLCEECQKGFRMDRCKHDKEGMHSHIKITKDKYG